MRARRAPAAEQNPPRFEASSRNSLPLIGYEIIAVHVSGTEGDIALIDEFQRIRVLVGKHLIDDEHASRVHHVGDILKCQSLLEEVVIEKHIRATTKSNPPCGGGPNC